MVQGAKAVEGRGVGKHHSADDIADSVDAGNAGLQVLVDDNAAPCKFDSKVGKVEGFEIRAAADGHQDQVALDGRFARLGDIRDGEAAARLSDTCYLRGSFDFDTTLAKRELQPLRQVGIEARKDSRSIFQNGNITAEAFKY